MSSPSCSSARSEFIDLFVMIGRLGRSLGVHLLLASQRLEEGKLRGLDTHLSYRIGLRTFSASESRVVLGVPDAYELPSAAGQRLPEVRHRRHDQVQGGVRVRAGGAGPGHPRLAAPGRPVIVPVRLPATSGRGDRRRAAAGMEPARRARRESLLDVVVAQLARRGAAAHQIWLPPLDVPPTLDQLLPRWRSRTVRVHGREREWRGRLRAVTGIVDRPFDQRRDPLWADLSGGRGPRGGGRRAAERQVHHAADPDLLAGAAAHPREVQFYCLDFGGGSLAGLTGLPHVGGVASRLDATRSGARSPRSRALLARREQEFADQGRVDLRLPRMRASGEIAGDGYGDVFLVVDGWLTLRQDFEQLEQAITAIAARGLGYGVHVLAAAGKWSEFRPAIRDLFGTRLELRLGDPYESEIDRRLAPNVPEARPAAASPARACTS